MGVRDLFQNLFGYISMCVCVCVCVCDNAEFVQRLIAVKHYIYYKRNASKMRLIVRQ